MGRASLDAPYITATIDAELRVDAIRRAKEWAASAEVRDESWLQVVHDGKSVASFKPGEF
jgi:hypothetical protein